MNRLVEKSSSSSANNAATRIKIGEPGTGGGNGNNNNNIILLRGAQSDGGHIILQNGQELLQLLNGGGDGGGGGKSGQTTATTTSGKTIILQSPRIKQQHAGGSTEAVKNVKNRIMIHQTTALDHQSNLHKSSLDVANLSHGGQGQSSMEGVGETILLQANGLSGKRISATTLSDGSILLHPRMMDSFTTTTTGGSSAGTTSQQSSMGNNASDGPILLQTLKRFDKSIFVLRNSSATTVHTAGGGSSTGKTFASNKMEINSSESVVNVVESEMPNPVVVAAVVNKKGSGGRGGANGATKANVFNSKASNVIGNGVNNNGRSNGISTRSSTGQIQKQQRGANKSDSNKKDTAGANNKSNIPLGSGE